MKPRPRSLRYCPSPFPSIANRRSPILNRHSSICNREQKSKEVPDFTVGKQKFKSDLIPVALLIARYFGAEQRAIDTLETELGALEQQLDERVEEQGAEGGLLEEVVEGDGDKRKITAKARLKEIGSDAEFGDEREALEECDGLLGNLVDARSCCTRA